MIWAVQPFSAQSVTTTQTVTSVAFNTQVGRLCGFHYEIADATSGTYVSVTARVIVASDSGGPFLLPVDSAGAVSGVLVQVNSNSRYIIVYS